MITVNVGAICLSEVMTVVESLPLEGLGRVSGRLMEKRGRFTRRHLVIGELVQALGCSYGISPITERIAQRYKGLT